MEVITALGGLKLKASYEPIRKPVLVGSLPASLFSGFSSFTFEDD